MPYEIPAPMLAKSVPSVPDPAKSVGERDADVLGQVFGKLDPHASQKTANPLVQLRQRKHAHPPTQTDPARY